MGQLLPVGLITSHNFGHVESMGTLIFSYHLGPYQFSKQNDTSTQSSLLLHIEHFLPVATSHPRRTLSPISSLHIHENTLLFVSIVSSRHRRTLFFSIVDMVAPSNGARLIKASTIVAIFYKLFHLSCLLIIVTFLYSVIF